MAGLPPPRDRRRLRAAAENVAYFIVVAFLAQTILNGLRGRMLRHSDGSLTPTQMLSDAEIEEVCQRYAVPEPPPYRPDKVELAAELIQELVTGGGIYNFVHNKTFTDKIATLTLGERERIAMEAGTVVYHSYDEAVQQLDQEAVRAPGDRRHSLHHLGGEAVLVKGVPAPLVAGVLACWLPSWRLAHCTIAPKAAPMPAFSSLLEWSTVIMLGVLMPHLVSCCCLLQAAVLKAAPHSDLTILNGVNVGVGGRQLHPSLVGIDVHRGRPEGAGGEVGACTCLVMLDQA